MLVYKWGKLKILFLLRVWLVICKEFFLINERNKMSVKRLNKPRNSKKIQEPQTQNMYSGGHALGFAAHPVLRKVIL